MIVKALAGAVALVLSTPVVPAVSPDLPAAAQEGMLPAVRPEVVQVLCDLSRGTAFYVGPHTLLSVAHVTSNEGCEIKGQPIKVIETSGDFTILEGAPSPVWLKIDCNGYQEGREYTAWGYARGLYTLTSTDLIATGELEWGLYRLWSVFTVIPGMSGGPNIDALTDKAVGTINTYNAGRGDSGSVQLKDTPICRGSALDPRLAVGG